MATKSLTFDIFGRDRSATKTIDGVSKASSRMGDGLVSAGKMMAAGLAVAGAAAVAFGIDSVKAYAEAEKSQARLADAFSRFPKLADTNIKTLGKLNSALAKKTRFDDDATASGQAVLAQFGLTGKQLEKITPLLQDYAAKTGQDLPTAAESLGKAMLGQGRALKEIGIDFTDTGTLAGNFDSVMGSLSEKVGGFAAVEGTTAAGKLEILRNRFGEIQEKIGEALMPALDGLVGYLNDDFMLAVENSSKWIAEQGIPGLQGMVDWVTKWKDILIPAAGAVGGLAGALGILTGAQWLYNAALTANPIGLVIVGLGALIVAGTALATNFGGVTNTIMQFGGSIFLMASKIALGLATIAQAFANGIGSMLNGILGPINTIRSALGLSAISIPPVNFTSGLQGLTNGLEKANAVTNKFDVVGGAAPVYRDGYGAPTTYRGGRALAAGGVVPATPGGGWFNVGEGKHDEAVIPLTRSVLSEIGAGIRSAGGGGGGGGIFTGNLILDSGEFMGKIRGEIRAADANAALSNRMGSQRS